MLRSILFAFGLFALALAGPAPAQSVQTMQTIPVAVRGYDAVAYFEQGHPVPGSAAHTHAWHDATWFFASDENRARFAADPQRYAPAYGGNCAFAVSKGYTAQADPEAWEIVDGRLFLNYNADVRAAWLEEAAERIRQADENWERMGSTEAQQSTQ